MFDLSIEEGDGQVLEPIEIEFEEQEGVNWRVAASEYIRDVLAGRVFDMPDGYRVAIPKGRNSRDRMVKGVRSQKRYEVIKGLERVFEVARLLREEEVQHKVGEGKKRRELISRVNRYDVFGYPLQINGHLCYGWFGAFNFDKDTPKDVVFYEFGVKEEDGFTGLAVGHDENHEVRPQLNPSSSEVTLGDLKRVVNGNNEGSETNFSAEWEYELVGIRKRAEEEGVFMKAPNGADSNLSERLWCVVRTKAFKAWFGDWENDPQNASKVVDENGEPLVVYHGTEKDFGNVFRDVHTDDDFENDDFGLLSAETFWFADKKFTAQTYQTGVFVPQGETKALIPAPHGSILISKEDTEFFFVRCSNGGSWTDGKRISASEALKKNGRLKKNCVAFLYLKKGASVPSGYQGLNGCLMSWSHWHDVALPRTHEEAVEKWNSFNEIQEMLAPASSRLYEVFLNIRNPKIIDFGGENFRGTGKLASQARREGHDGLILKNIRDPRSYPSLIENGCSIAVFSSNQIKSATDNRGTFDAKSDRIDMSLDLERAGDLTFEGEGVSKEDAWAHLESLEGVALVNDRSGFVAVINKPQRKELTNINKAKMSAQNGFSKNAHYAVVSRIEKVFKYAIPSGEYPDLKHGDKNVKIYRFACPLVIKGEKAVAWLTAKQTTNVEGSERLYNLELVDIEMLAVTLEYLASHRLDTALRPASRDIMAEIMDSYKTYFGESNFSLAEAKGLGVMEDGVGVFGNAVVVEPGTDFDIEALHASPHLFGKFDTAFMGSGEGNQAYGWGFYFATRYGVNEWYFNSFNQVIQAVVTIDGKPLREIVAQAPVDSPLGIAYNSCYKDINYLADIIYREIHNPEWKKPLVARFERIIDACKKSLADESTPVSHRKEIENNLFDAQQKLDELAIFADIINTHDVEAIQQGATNYKVTLKAEDDELLMWDEKVLLSKFSESVRQGFEELTGALDSGFSSGEDFYHILVKALGSPKAASEWLLERGIKGVKYADSGSRGRRGEKFYNYVMFSGDDVVIEKIDRGGEWNVDFEKWENPSDVFGETNHSLLGEHAKTFWEYDESRMFKGRDDGKLRVEIDSSVAGLKEEWKNDKEKKIEEFEHKLWEDNKWAYHKGLEVFKEIVAKYGEDFLEKWGEVGERYHNSVYSNSKLSVDMEGVEAAKKEWLSLGDKGQELMDEMQEKLGELHNAFSFNVSMWYRLGRDVRMGEEEWDNILGRELGEWIIKKREEARENGKFNRRALERETSMGKVFDFPELYAAYPELKDLTFDVYQIKYASGIYIHHDKTIVLDEEFWQTDNDEWMKSVILHELGHAVQDIEGWAYGGSSEWAKYKVDSQLTQVMLSLKRAHEKVRWFSVREIAIDFLKGIRRLQKNPKSILKMGLRFDVKEMQDVNMMAEQGIEFLIDKYKELRDVDDGHTYRIFKDVVNGKDSDRWYYLPWFNKESYEKDKEGYVERMLSYVKEDMVSRNNKKWQKELKKEREAEVERLYKEKEWLDAKSQLSDKELYYQLAGETESRAIARRMGMSMEERLAKPFNESLDRAAEDTIVYTRLGGDFKPSMSYGSEFSVTATDRRGGVLSEDTFVLTPSGEIDWFYMPKRKGQGEMPVRLLVGADWGGHRGYGLVHIAASRDEDGLWEKTSPAKYIAEILENASEVYLQGDREILVKGKNPKSWMVLQLSKEDGYYSIITAYPIRNLNKKPIGERISLVEHTSKKNSKKNEVGIIPTNSATAQNAFGATLENNPSLKAQTAGGRSGVSLPSGVKVVNINDVELRFDDGGVMEANWSLETFSKEEALKQGKLVYSRDKKEEIEKAVRSYQRSILSMKETLNLLAVSHGFKGRVLTEADLVKGESREREDETNYCIIGEGSEVFREYEEAGLVYVDKADGKKKAVLDNRGVKLKYGLGGVPRTGAKVTSLGAVLEYPELFRAYPELKKLRVDFFRGEPHLGGYAVQEENYIAVNVESGAWTSPLRTILHEVQHIIQGAEGFARGAFFR